MPVVGRAGIFSQKGLEFVVWDPGGSDEFMPEGAMEVSTKAKRIGDMIRERHEDWDGMRRGEHEGVNKPI